jgi:hypothetical protein
MRTLTTLILAGAASISTIGAALGQVPMLEFTADAGWKCHPATQSGQEVGFIVEQVEVTTAPNPITVAWYERTGDDFAMTQGWQDASALEAALKVVVQRGQTDLFAHSTLGPDVAEAVATCEVEPVDGVAVESGLAANDPFQTIAPSLSPAEMEFIVEIGATGATTLSAKEVSYIETDDGQATIASKELHSLAQRIEADIAGTDGLALSIPWFCWPGTYCRSTSVTGPCNLIGGFGNGSCSDCKYSCTVTTFTTCAYISIDCTVGPATTTTTTTTRNKSCPGDPTNGPPTPPPGC